MKRIKSIVFILFILLFTMHSVQAQGFLDRLKKKAMESTKRLESDDEEKADREKNIEKSEGFNLKSMMDGLGLSTNPVPVEDVYRFGNLIKMHIESYNKHGKKSSESDFITYFDPNSESVAYQAIDNSNDGNNARGIFIIDTKNKATIILSDNNGEKTGLVYGLEGYLNSIGSDMEDEEVDMAETPEAYLANPNVTKTGKTKTIAGYKCEEFVYKDESGESHIWVTKDLKLKTGDFMGALFKTSTVATGMGWGYVMESTMIDYDDGSKSVMRVTEVDENANTRFSLAGYEITNLGTVQPPPDK